MNLRKLFSVVIEQMARANDPPQLRIYRTMLASHDWDAILPFNKPAADHYFRMAELQPMVDPDFSIWNDYAPERHRFQPTQEQRQLRVQIDMATYGGWMY